MVNYLIYEGSKHSCTFNDAPVFEDSCQMPWTHYEVSVKLNTEGDGSILKENNLGASMIMFTSESNDGVAVKQITKYRTTTQGKLERIDYRNPTEDTYNEWGWKLEVKDGQTVLPKIR